MSFFSWVKSRFRHRQEQQQFDARLEQLAHRDIEDAIAEEDVHLIVALLEAGARETAADKRERRTTTEEAS